MEEQINADTPEDSSIPSPILSQKTKDRIEAIEHYLKLHYDFKYNIVTGRLEFKEKRETVYRIMNDLDENAILIKILKEGIPCSKDILTSLLRSDFCEVYDPIKDYFEKLPKWDGKTDYIDQLAQSVETTEDLLWKKAFRKWLVACVACAIIPEAKNHNVLVFSGKQGIGKTSWAENLVPGELKNYYFSGTINPDSKDCLSQLTECFLINLDELENLTKGEIGSLKSLITRGDIRMRRPYGRNHETLPRRASFIGSVNTLQFLSDITGSRRFLSFEVLSIDYTKIDIDKVYAQAYHLLTEKNFQYWFDQDETIEITSNNEQYELLSMEEECLLAVFAKPENPTEKGVESLTNNDILRELALAFPSAIKINRTAQLNLSRVLHKHKFARRKSNGRLIFRVKRLSFEERIIKPNNSDDQLSIG